MCIKAHSSIFNWAPQLRDRIEKEIQVHCELIFSKHSAAMTNDLLFFKQYSLRYSKIYPWIKQRQLRTGDLVHNTPITQQVDFAELCFWQDAISLCWGSLFKTNYEIHCCWGFFLKVVRKLSIKSCSGLFRKILEEIPISSYRQKQLHFWSWYLLSEHQIVHWTNFIYLSHYSQTRGPPGGNVLTRVHILVPTLASFLCSSPTFFLLFLDVYAILLYIIYS